MDVKDYQFNEDTNMIIVLDGQDLHCNADMDKLKKALDDDYKGFWVSDLLWVNKNQIKYIILKEVE